MERAQGLKEPPALTQRLWPTYELHLVFTVPNFLFHIVPEPPGRAGSGL